MDFTEKALMTGLNYILMQADSVDLCVLGLLYLSSAFDEIIHGILVEYERTVGWPMWLWLLPWFISYQRGS